MDSLARQLFVLMLFFSALTPAIALAEGKLLTLGWIERAHLYPGKMALEAKLDTGAQTSSLHCKCQPFNQDGKEWVRFQIQGTDGRTVVVERPIIRTARITRQSGHDEFRPVVMIGLCLANRYREVEFTLVDRTGFEYPLLVGRNFLRHEKILVHSGKKNMHDPSCTEAQTP